MTPCSRASCGVRAKLPTSSGWARSTRPSGLLWCASVAHDLTRVLGEVGLPARQVGVPSEPREGDTRPRQQDALRVPSPARTVARFMEPDHAPSVLDPRAR